MSTKLEILNILNERPGDFVSGGKIAAELGISRNSVWKAVRALQEQGYMIESKANCGYRLSEKKDILSSEHISRALSFPCKVCVLETVDSTNNYAKALTDLSCPIVVLAERQTGGRGRLGRSFFSPPSTGLYMTIAFNADLAMDKAMLVTIISSLAVCRAFKEVAGVSAEIKWVNDVYVSGRKACGILTEAESNIETGRLAKIVTGIGVNCFPQDFPAEIAGKASFVGEAGAFTRNELASSICENFFRILNDFDNGKIIEEYKRYSMILGKPISIYGTSFGELPENGGKGISATALDIDQNGGLVVRYDESRNGRLTDTLIGGEVTIRAAAQGEAAGAGDTAAQGEAEAAAAPHSGKRSAR